MIDFHLSIILFSVFIISAVLTGLIRRYALKHEMIDNPNARSSHEVPTPRGGGAAIIITFLAGIFLLPEAYRLPGNILYALLGGGILVGGIGFWDDHGHIRARWRVLVQLMAAAWSVFLLLKFPQLQRTPVEILWNCLIALAPILFIVYMINIYNFMDGIDGIAAIEAITVGIASAILLYSYGNRDEAMIASGFLIAAGSLGFLFWNWPPAKIFMGDSGSGFLGYLFGFFIVISTWFFLFSQTASEFIMLLTLPFLLGVFIIDSTITLLRRVLRGEKFWVAHRMHAYQHAARRWGHKRVTIAVGLINIFFLLPCAWAACRWFQFKLWIMAAAWLVLIIAALLLSAGRPEKAKN